MWDEILMYIIVLGFITIGFLLLWFLLMPSTGIKKIKITIGYCVGVVVVGVLIAVGKIVLELIYSKFLSFDIPDMLFPVFYLIVCLVCGLSIFAGYATYIIPKSDNVDTEGLLHSKRKTDRIYLPLFIATYILGSMAVSTSISYHELVRFPIHWHERMLNELSILSIIGIWVLAFVGGLLLIHYNKYKELYSLYQGALGDSEEIIKAFEQRFNIPEELQTEVKNHKKALQDLLKLDIYWTSDIPHQVKRQIRSKES